MQLSTIGIDIAKNVFQVHGVDAQGTVALTRQLRRKQLIEFFAKLEPCLIGMEACATAHHWARELGKPPRIEDQMVRNHNVGAVRLVALWCP